MSDRCLSLLQARLPELEGKTLWLGDEGSHGDKLSPLLPYSAAIDFHTNRYDVHQQALALGLNSTFNDWVFEDEKRYSNVVLRVCKEKAINQHLIISAHTLLVKGGRFLLAGQKNEGIKSYEKLASEVFTGNAKAKHLSKNGNCYFADFLKTDHHIEPDNTYHHIVEIGQWQGLPLYSKPGVYGWNKIDVGSLQLIEALENLRLSERQNIKSVLDIGCGYGLLTIASASINCERRAATDNNAAALQVCNFNAQKHEIELEVVAGDCADTVEGKFDLVLCNPPFHKGFDTDGDLTSRFLSAAKSKLSQKGFALFVVNSFIPIEKKLTRYFTQYQTLTNTGQFKVVKLW